VDYDSPVAFECRLLNALSFNSDRAVILGEVSTAIVSDDLVLDAASLDDLVGTGEQCRRNFCRANGTFQDGRRLYIARLPSALL
jgi:hypothetical protein